MRPFDEFGFPTPATFEDEHLKNKSPRRSSGWRMLVLGILAAAIVGGMVQWSRDVADNPPDLLRSIGRGLDGLFGTSIEAIGKRYQAKIQANDLEGALAETDRLVEIAPQIGHFWRAETLVAMERRAEAIEEYTKALEADCPAKHHVYNNRAYMRALERVDLKQALADVELAIRIRGDEPAYIDTRGYLYYLLGEPELALRDFDSILENENGLQGMGPGAGEIYFHRGLVHRFLGNEDKASQDFLAAQQLGFTIEEYPEPVYKPVRQQN